MITIDDIQKKCNQDSVCLVDELSTANELPTEESIPKELDSKSIAGEPLDKQPLVEPSQSPVHFDSQCDEPLVPKVIEEPSSKSDTNIEQLERDVKSIVESSSRTAIEIREMHKLYHNEFANRLQSMQEELERYREIDKGRIFDGILGEVAKLYSDNESVLCEISNEKVKKNIRYMFLDIIQILEANGVLMQKSNPGDKRNTRYCHVVERVQTDNSDLHDTVVQSRSTGFYVENRALIKELVDIYLYTEKTADNSVEI